MLHIDSPHGAGLVGLSCGELARFTEFQACFDGVMCPAGSVKGYGVGYDTASNSNDLIRQMYPEHGWVWIMDDDHAFDGDLLMRLLDRQVDLVVPFYLQRKPPFRPVIYTALPDGRFEHIELQELLGQSGLMKIDSAGKGGVLIRRPVLAAMAGADCVCPYPQEDREARKRFTHQPGCVWPRTPFFEHAGLIGEDHRFFTKAKELGFQLHVDLDAPIEHITLCKVSPAREGEEWVGQVNLYNDVRVVIRQLAADPRC